MEVIGESIKVPVTIIRGGTSKGIFIKKEFLPSDTALRDKLILGIFGSPDKRQIDGLGGADPLTSKLAIISSSSIKGVDVNYTFAQVEIDKPVVDYSLTCGNLMAGVAVFAIDKGMVEVKEPITEVMIFNTNTNKKIKALVKVKNGKALIDGHLHIDGVAGTGSKIELEFLRPEGPITGKLFPFEKNSFLLGNGINVTVGDAGVLACFMKASNIGLKGDEGPKEIDSNSLLLNKVKEIKAEILTALNMVKNKEEAFKKYPNLPKFVFVSEPKDFYSPINGKLIKKSEIDLLARVITGGKLHKAFPVTSGIATAVAACIPGTILAEVIGNSIKKGEFIEKEKRIRIGHPSGVMKVKINLRKQKNNWLIEKAVVGRTARIIMDGIAYVPLSKLKR